MIQLDQLPTEQQNPNTACIDRLSTLDMVRVINDEDKKVAFAVEKELVSIAAAVDAGIMGYRMYLHDREFRRGEGIVSDSVDKTIRNVGILAQQGMLQTDRTILEIMQQK